MPTAAWVPLAMVLAAALGAVGAWAAARNTLKASKDQRSGRIETTEAHDLWEESKSIREELRSENNSMRLRLAEAETKLAETLQKLAETNMRLLSTQNVANDLREEVLELRRLCGKTNADVEAVSRELRIIKSDSPEAHQARQEAEDQ